MHNQIDIQIYKHAILNWHIPKLLLITPENISLLEFFH